MLHELTGGRLFKAEGADAAVSARVDRPGHRGAASPVPTTRRLRIDFLFLDLKTCARCLGTNRSLDVALELARESIQQTGTEVEVRRIHVTSAEQARALRLRSSPTIRVNGRDVALELRESSCGSEACTDGCGESIACRVWVHNGREHTEAPVSMVVDAILREVYARPVVLHDIASERYGLPENLERFFAARTAVQAETSRELPMSAESSSPAACCAPVEQRSCCDPADKAECCGASSGEECGCR